jgi:hypothetical protein
MVTDDKGAYRCLDYDVRSWHVGSWNRWSIGICNIGTESESKKEALICLTAIACLELDLSPGKSLLFHRDAPGYYKISKDKKVYFNNCPGFDFKEFSSQVKEIYRELRDSIVGVIGGETVSATKEFQKENSLPVTGRIDYNIVEFCYGLGEGE